MAVPIHREPCHECGGPRSIYAKELCRQCWLNSYFTEEDIWTYMDFKPDDENAPPLGYCWEWRGGRKPSGYGRITLSGGRRELVHRIAYQTTHPGADKSLLTCHHCDNPPCMRPSHLFEGTSADNNEDKMIKGRGAIGSKHGHAIITESDVLEICRLRASGWTYLQIREKYGMTHVTLWQILSGATWKHVDRSSAVGFRFRGKITPEVTNQILTLNKAGVTYKDIAERLGVSRSSVGYALQRQRATL